MVKVNKTELPKAAFWGGADIEAWDPENEQNWNIFGQKIAKRNLWISISCLLCGFAVWMYWSIITVQMLSLGFPFEQAELFTLSAIAGLSGATLRIPSSFLIRVAGGRNTVFFTTALLILPALGTGMALQDQDTPLWVFQILALLSGFGGGNFASSMSNISFFYPKKEQGLALGLNAGLGNFGVTTMQMVTPLLMTIPLFGGAAMVLRSPSGSVIGRIPEGTETWIHNAGYIWVAVLLVISALAWFGMNNIRANHVSPNISGPVSSMGKIAVMLLIGLLTAGTGLWLMLPAEVNGAGIEMSKWLIMPLVIAATVLLLKMIPGAVGKTISHQYRIFKHPHTWIMTVIYTMTFGSFIGYAAAFPLAIKVIFGYQHLMIDGVMTHDTLNPAGPNALMFAWLGPFIGALVRPVGGWLGDKFGGARVTQISSLIMVAAALGVAYYMKAAYGSAAPEQYFIPFFLLFMVLFLTSGIGNGSTFRTVAKVFDRELAGPVLGWTSAVAAYGAFIIPQVFGEQIKATTPEIALYGFAAFYMVCVILNWAVYLRPGAKYKNP